jgi:uncharacterized membrane protein YgdD (TMEM256/DUF423 family)
MERMWIGFPGLRGAAAVGADAAARHLLAGDPWRMNLASTAARYGLLHAAALLGVAGLALGVWGSGLRGAARFWLLAAGWCFAAGMVFFCGSLYALAAGAPPAAAQAAPVGGVLLIAGWAAVLVSALSPRSAGSR